MLQIDDKIISLDLLKEYFYCDLEKCLGICCVEGDAGAPLNEAELSLIESILEKIKKYLPENNIEFLKKNGFYEKDPEGDWVTTCLNGKECVFAFKENGIYKCAIEKAWENREISFRKPISCHLFPVRIKKYASFTAVNFVKANICKAAFVKGKVMNIKAYEFLREPLTRVFGKKFFEQLEYAAKNLKLD